MGGVRSHSTSRRARWRARPPRRAWRLRLLHVALGGGLRLALCAGLAIVASAGAQEAAGPPVDTSAGAPEAAGPPVDTDHAVTVRAVDVAAGTVEVADGDGATGVFSVDPAAHIVSGPRKLSLGDLGPGYRVLLDVEDRAVGRRVTFVEVVAAPGSSGTPAAADTD